MTTMSLRSLILSLSLAGAAALAYAGSPITVSAQIDLAAPPAKVWGAIKDFDGLQNWHPVIATSTLKSGKANAKGAVRTLKTKDGATVTEELLSHDEKKMAYSYRMTDTPLPVSDFRSTIKVIKTKAGSTVAWTSDFNAKDGTNEDEARNMVDGFFKTGLDSLKAKLD